jgi:hypothetical protein
MKKSELKTLILECKRELQEEGNANTKFKDAYAIIEALDKCKECSKYKDVDAAYDDEAYKMPLDLFLKVTGMDKAEVDALEDSLNDDYELGWININERRALISIGGAA